MKILQYYDYITYSYFLHMSYLLKMLYNGSVASQEIGQGPEQVSNPACAPHPRWHEWRHLQRLVALLQVGSVQGTPLVEVEEPQKEGVHLLMQGNRFGGILE